MSMTPSMTVSASDRQQAETAVQRLQVWHATQYTKKPESLATGMELVSQLYRVANISTLVPIVPYLLQLKGEPMSLADHFMFEPMYKRTGVPRTQVWCTGRQVAKSTSIAASGILRTSTTPNYNTIYITPLFEQIRRFSSNYVRPFIRDSPVRSALVGEKLNDGTQNVLQRTFANGSIMFFTFMFLDADRVRGISADAMCIDEAQDINFDFIAIAEQCLAASKFRLVSYTGTPKSQEGTLTRLFEKSSRAEWVTKCDMCGYWNTAALALDLDKMIQKQGLCCAKCGRFINPRLGHWEHQIQDRDLIRDFPGYHVPQVLLPLHYANPDNWRRIIAFKNSNQQAKYYNECLGEPCDVATKLISLTDLKGACTNNWNNTLEDALKMYKANSFSYTTMGVDWGGGAGGIVRRVRGVLVVQEGSASFTLITIIGFEPSAPTTPVVLYAERLPGTITPHEEAKRIIQLFNMFGCYRLGHDFGGSGRLSEQILLQFGFPHEKLFPCLYVPAMNGRMVQWKRPIGGQERNYYTVDKARSLSLLCSLIKNRGCKMPRWESMRDVAEDFLALVADKRDRPSQSDLMLVVRDPSKTDDFCHSLNFGCVSHWHSRDMFPDMTALFEAQLTREEVEKLYPNPEELQQMWADESGRS